MKKQEFMNISNRLKILEADSSRLELPKVSAALRLAIEVSKMEIHDRRHDRRQKAAHRKLMFGMQLPNKEKKMRRMAK